MAQALNVVQFPERQLQAVRISEGQLRSREKAELQRLKAEKEHMEDPLMSLANYLQKAWEAAYRAKQFNIQKILLECARQRKGEYDPDKQTDIEREGGSQVYMLLTSIKCRSLESWLTDVHLPPGEKPWSIDPTPVPDLPKSMESDVYAQVEAEIQQFMQMYGPDAITKDWVLGRLEQVETDATTKKMQMARKTAKRIEKVIEDQLVEGGFYEALAEFINDLATFPTAILKGPVIRKRPRMVWTEDRDGNYTPATEEKYIREWYTVPSHDAFPSPGSKHINDGYFIEKLRLRRRDLEACMGVPGFKDEALEGILQQYGTKGFRLHSVMDQEREDVEDRENWHEDPDPPIEGIEFWGTIQGSLLQEWGMPKEKVRDANKDYQVCCWLIDKWVPMARLNPDPLGDRPYYATSYEKINGSFWGKSPPQLMRDIQGICNATARAQVNNLGIACLTGDTVVYRTDAYDKEHNSAKDYSEITIKELWDKKHQHNSGLRRMKLRCLDEKTHEFYYNRIVDVIDNGIAKVYEVVTKHGYRIKATMNHRFLNYGMGWQALENFKVGDFIGVNGTDEKPSWMFCSKCGKELNSQVKYRKEKITGKCLTCTTKEWNQKQIEMARDNQGASETTARQRKECRDAMKDSCEICGGNYRLEIHHEDRKPHNNDPANLACLCDTCHKFEHKRYDNFGDPYKHRYLDHDEIISIEYVGKDRVYDLCMTAPDHNFVANGVVSHNSGPMYEWDVDRVMPGTDMENLYPWKGIPTQNNRGRTHPAVSFYQPDPIIDVLMKVYEYYSNQASEQTGIPDYIGTQQYAKGIVASTLSMLMNAASKTMKGVVMHIDNDIIKRAIKKHWMHVMLTDTTIRKFGDINVVARASEHMIMEEQLQLRRTEWLRETNNPTDMAIIGQSGRAQVLRESVKSLKLPAEKVVPDEMEMEKRDIIERQYMQMMAQQQLLAEQEEAERQGGQVPTPEPKNITPAGGPKGEMMRVNS